uniref:Uncharacterized protein n=1 Tax=viral metagenome TaxID=1070528 RepID=A0A6C0CXA8_9ZZZZ
MLSYEYTLAALSLMLVLFLYKLDVHMIVYNYGVKLQDLNSLVSTRNKNILKVLYISFAMIAQALYLSFLQYMNSAMRKIGKNKYEISYMVNGKIYKMLVTPKRGPSPILEIRDEKTEDDLTDKILPYFGPDYKCHGNNLYPELLGYNGLVFELADGTEKVFIDNEIITV